MELFSIMAAIKRRPWFMTAGVALLSAIVTSLVLSPLVRADDKSTVRQLTLFANAFDQITENYVDDVDEKALIEAAIQGMLQSLDPHSGFFTMDAFEDVTEELQGTFGGIGIQISMEEGVVLVIAPIDGTPGAKAGLAPQDLITNIDGEPVQGKTLQEAVERMRGPIGTDVTLTVLRRRTGEIFDVTVTRGVIPEQSVRGFRVNDNIGYIDLFQFTDTTADNLKREIAKIEALSDSPLLGYILDLRGNPGGTLRAAIEVSDAFLDRGEIVSTRGRFKQDNRSIFAQSGQWIDDVPMVVLINAGSASASEIVAGALQDHDRATLIGTRSFGKGSVQSLVPLAENTGMRLTTALYFTPSGRSIQAVGIEPDVLIDFDNAEARDYAGNVIREEYYDNEITVNNGQKEVDATSSVNAVPALVAAAFARHASTDDNVIDIQLRAAMAHLLHLVGIEYDPTKDLVIDDGRINASDNSTTNNAPEDQ